MPTPQIEHRYPCQNCGASLEFAPGQNALTCPYCGHVQTISPGAGRAPARQHQGGPDGQDVLHHSRAQTFRDSYTVDLPVFNGGQRLDWRLAAAIGVGLDALQQR